MSYREIKENWGSYTAFMAAYKLKPDSGEDLNKAANMSKLWRQEEKNAATEGAGHGHSHGGKPCHGKICLNLAINNCTSLHQNLNIEYCYHETKSKSNPMH